MALSNGAVGSCGSAALDGGAADPQAPLAAVLIAPRRQSKGPSTAAAGLGIVANAAAAGPPGVEGWEAGAAAAAVATVTTATAARRGRKRLASHGSQTLEATAPADPAAPAADRPKRGAKQAAAAAIAATAIRGRQRASGRPAGVTAAAAIAAAADLAPEPASALATGELQGGSEGALGVDGRQGAKASVRRNMDASASRAPRAAAPSSGGGDGGDAGGMQEGSDGDEAAAGVGERRTVRAQRKRKIAAPAAPASGPSGAGAACDGEREDSAAEEQPPKPRAGRKGRGRGSAKASMTATAAERKAAEAKAEAVPVAAAAASPRKNRAGGGVSDPRVAVLSAEEAEALQDQPLLDLGELVAGALVRRPSTAIRTPYVADVRLLPSPPPPTPKPPRGTLADADAPLAGGPAARDDDDGCGRDDEEGGRMVLAHAPALDCAGMIIPGSRLYLSVAAARRAGAPPLSTSHSIQLVEEQRPGGGVAMVGCHPQLAEQLAAELLRRRCLEGPLGLGPYEGVDCQRTFGSTRVDFVLRMADGSWTLLEVKNVVCADFPEGGVPAGRPAMGVYTVPVPPEGNGRYQPTALFPHGAAKPKIKVVSDRAIKHVWELTQLHQAGLDQETGRRLHCAVLFVVNRSDCTAFRPCHEADPLFAQVVKAAAEAGVKLLAFDICWSGGKARLGKQLPVVFGSGVSSQYDSDRLREVLHFNATDPRKNWKAKAKKKGKD